MRLTARPGATLAATLVALALSAVALGLVARTTVAALALHARSDAQARGGHDLADAFDALGRRLRHARPDAGDLLDADASALALHVVAGSTLLCDRTGDTLLLAGAQPAHPWAASASVAPAAGDRLRVASGAAAARPATAVREVRRVDAPCAPALRAWPLRAAWRVVVADSLPPLPAGTPLHHLVRERIASYTGTDGLTALGLADWDAALARWAPPQPLVAPLAPGALRVAVLDAAGTPLPAARLGEAQLVRLVARHAAAPHPDTLLIHVAAP